jgi:hypothetical protein
MSHGGAFAPVVRPQRAAALREQGLLRSTGTCRRFFNKPALNANGARLVQSNVRPSFSSGSMSVFDHVLAGGAVVCSIATWIFPLLRFALSSKRRSSLAAVGFTIGVFVVTAYISAAGLVLALLAVLFAQGGSLAWFGLLAIAVFWLSLATAIYIGGRRARGQKETEVH